MELVLGALAETLFIPRTKTKDFHALDPCCIPLVRCLYFGYRNLSVLYLAFFYIDILYEKFELSTNLNIYSTHFTIKMHCLHVIVSSDNLNYKCEKYVAGKLYLN